MTVAENQPFFRAPQTVYAAALNDCALLARLAPELNQPPYKAPPVAPILYIKTRNTLVGEGAQVTVPADPGVVRVEATVGVVIGREAKRVKAGDALAHVLAYVIASDITLPHDNYYRPAIRQRCRDGFCPMSAPIVVGAGFDVSQAKLSVAVNGTVVHQRGFDALVRPLAQLIADVSAFMTLSVGDVLLLGASEGAPLARAGDAIRVEVKGLGSLSHQLVAERSDEKLVAGVSA